MTSLPRYYDVTNPATMTSLPFFIPIGTPPPASDAGALEHTPVNPGTKITDGEKEKPLSPEVNYI